MHRRRLIHLLLSIHDGQLPRGTRQQRRHGRVHYGLLTRIAIREEGYINFVSCFLFMAFVLGLCLVGNVGRWTNQRMEMQNAADSAAYSSSLQMARGMNAITATNHMMGELTGLVVILDSFVGRERLRDGSGLDEVDTESIRKANERIESFKANAPYPDPSQKAAGEVVYGPALHRFDKQYIDLVYKLFVQSALGKHRSHAALYDAQLALKHNLAMALMFKNGFTIVNHISQLLITVGNVPILVFLKALGWVGELAATAGHLTTDFAIFGMAKEWVLLQALQTVIQLPVVPAFIEFTESALIPALSFHADSVTGKTLLGSVPGLGPPAGPMNRAVEETVTNLQRELGITTLATFPSPDQLVLPVEQEPAEGSEDGDGEKLWSQGAASVPDDSVDGPMQKLMKVFSTILGPIADIKEEIGFVTDILEWIIDPPLLGWVTDFLGDIGILNKQQAKAIQGQLDEVTGNFAKLGDLLDAVELMGQGVPKNGYDDNPSKQHLIDHPFDWEAERRSQWTRASYPYVDSFRVPIRDLFRKGAGVANASTYYAQWSNRDTLIQCYEIRHDDGGLTQPHMYIMKDSSADQKGQEVWTDEDPRMAEQMFTLTAYALRANAPPRLLEDIFPAPDSKGRVCHAQAMVYNANGRDLGASGDVNLQPNTGWDTLNWEAPVAAPEWGAPPSDRGRSESGGIWPWEIPTQFPWDVFTGRPPESTARVRLNWQAKLIPLTASRLQDAMDSAQLPGDIDAVMQDVQEDHFNSLIHH